MSFTDSRHSARRGDISQASPHHPNGQVTPISSPDHPSSCHNGEYELNPSDLALASVPGNNITMATVKIDDYPC